MHCHGEEATFWCGKHVFYADIQVSQNPKVDSKMKHFVKEVDVQNVLYVPNKSFVRTLPHERRVFAFNGYSKTSLFGLNLLMVWRDPENFLSPGMKALQKSMWNLVTVLLHLVSESFLTKPLPFNKKRSEMLLSRWEKSFEIKLLCRKKILLIFDLRFNEESDLGFRKQKII